MSRAYSIVFALCLLVISSGNLHAASPDEEAVARLMNQDLAAAWKSNSPGKVLEVFSEAVPVVWLDAGKTAQPVTGKEARKKELENYFDKMKVVDFVVTDLAVSKISDTQAMVVCMEKVTTVDNATKERATEMVRTAYEVVKEKDKWRVIREISFGADEVD